MSKEHKLYLRKLKLENIYITIIQLSLLIGFFVIWELLSKYNIINSFIFSSPSKIIKTFYNLYLDNNLFIHIYTTIYEIILSISISFTFAFFISLLFYINPFIKKILDPFITLINGLPKVALGPLIIIWIGANTKSIIFMSLLISLIVTQTTILNGFLSTDKDNIKLFKVFGASKLKMLKYLILPSAKKEMISALKLNLSMNFIGVIMGEFLSCKKGIGYLILYGTQVFNLSLVMCGIFLLIILSYIFYKIIIIIEKKN